MDFSTPGFPVHHQLPELAQTHVHRIGDTSQPFHPCPLLLGGVTLHFDVIYHQCDLFQPIFVTNKIWTWDFPGDPVVKNLPFDAWKAGSITEQGTKIPSATGQLSPGSKTRDTWDSPQLGAFALWSLQDPTKGPAWHNEDPACCN